jgi:hypothetical protein
MSLLKYSVLLKGTASAVPKALHFNAALAAEASFSASARLFQQLLSLGDKTDGAT